VVCACLALRVSCCVVVRHALGSAHASMNHYVHLWLGEITQSCVDVVLRDCVCLCLLFVVHAKFQAPMCELNAKKDLKKV